MQTQEIRASFLTTQSFWLSVKRCLCFLSSQEENVCIYTHFFTKTKHIMHMFHYMLFSLITHLNTISISACMITTFRFPLHTMCWWIPSLHTQLSVNTCFGFVCFLVWPITKVSVASTSYSKQSILAVWWEKNNLVSLVYFRSFGKKSWDNCDLHHMSLKNSLKVPLRKGSFPAEEVNLSTCSLLSVKAHVARQESCLWS